MCEVLPSVLFFCSCQVHRRTRMSKPVWADPIESNNVEAVRALLDRNAFTFNEVGCIACAHSTSR